MTADNPTRMSGAAQQVETRREQVEAIVGPAVTFYSIADTLALAAAERAVINEAVDWYGGDWNPNKLEDAVRELLRLRVAREPKP